MISILPRQSFRQVSQVQVHQGRHVSTPHSLLSTSPPPPARSLPSVTAWHYDRGAVALLWQQAGRPGYVLVKRTACQKQSETERQRETQVPPNSWTQAPSPTPKPPSLRPFKHHPDPGNTKYLSFIIITHMHSARPFILLLLFPNLCIHPWSHPLLNISARLHFQPPFSHAHTQTHTSSSCCSLKAHTIPQFIMPICIV